MKAKHWLKSYGDVPAEINADRYTSVVHMLEGAMQRYAAKTAFCSFGKTLSYADVDRLSAAFCAYLQHQLGVTKGDRVAVMSPNFAAFPVAFLGIARAGAVQVNVNPLYTARELEHQLNDAGCQTIVIFTGSTPVLAEIIGKTAIKTVITVAWAYHDNVSVELLALKQNDAMSQECVARLVQWGLLEKKSSNVYCVDTQLQRELRFLCMTQVKANLEGDLEYTPPSADSDDDDGDHISNSSVRSQCFMVAVNMAGGLWTMVKQFQFHRTPRLANRVATLLLLAGGLVPIAADWKQSRTSSYSLTALNLVCLYLLGKILGHVVYVVLYAGVGMTLALLTGFWLHAPPLQSSARLGRNCATTALVVACIGYCVFWDDRGSAVRRGIGRSEL